ADDGLVGVLGEEGDLLLESIGEVAAVVGPGDHLDTHAAPRTLQPAQHAPQGYPEAGEVQVAPDAIGIPIMDLRHPEATAATSAVPEGGPYVQHEVQGPELVSHDSRLLQAEE